MNDHIDWKARYIDLEEQMLDMMKMTARLVDKEVHNQSAKITGINTMMIDEQLEVIVKSKSSDAQYLFELITLEEEVLIKKFTHFKNSYKFNTQLINEPFRVRVSIKNQGHGGYDDINVTKVLNQEEGIV
ncbi:hypothetical protein ERX37_04680 [Macrococcus hajekii]|uniref:Uncharacterized protein n=1 Tax=Macrococcus hajekii TaxID=198482 RepID=A0A4R6BNF2_9STAP|nr:hypothetical protein [Macrococcus hajekii]TDM03383.1 hypothetical protein ERX37_04680 [Macrococcus hajekii]GGA98399.1 hypothetical protein GCM10007190_03020 [Macrococcus hajekii]